MKALISFSGGQDSTTLLAWAKEKFEYVETITFNYGQRHNIEIEQAIKIAKIFKTKNTILNIDALLKLNDSSLLDGNKMDMDKHHDTHKNLPSSFVPNRNAILFTLAHAFAQKKNISNIIIGINQTDYSGYPDCREDFIISLEKTLNLGSESNIKFHYPLINLSKAQTFKLSKDLNILDIIIEESHTCYYGIRDTKNDWGYGCGKCPACILRKNGWIEFIKQIKS